MIPKSGKRFSDKIMLKQKALSESHARGLDDVEMDATAARAAHGPVLAAAAPDSAGNDFQYRKATAALRAGGQHRRGGRGGDELKRRHRMLPGYAARSGRYGS